MKRRLASPIAAAAALSIGSPASAQQQPNLVERSADYLRAQQTVMERTATSADVDTLLQFYSANYVYRDARVGITVTGRDKVREGTSSHLGETSDPAIIVDSVLATGDAVAMRVRISFKITATGQRVERTNLIVLRYAGGKIAERIDL